MKKEKKRKRKLPDEGREVSVEHHHDKDNKKVSKKERKESKKRRKEEKNKAKTESSSSRPLATIPSSPSCATGSKKKLPFPHQYILAPMVGASELPFRLLCRQYGAQLAYTPMMSAASFAHDTAYREAHFSTCATDRPLVCHFAANTPDDLAAAARVAAPFCDAIDLNLGCPQRTAYLGHFGSYLLGDKDRNLVCRMVKAAATAVSLPILVKIRLLDTLDETIQLCRQLQDAGASLIAVHARYRASWERKGPGARDGPALLDQVTIIKQQLKIPVIANGNTITYDDVVKNLQSTGADGLMSAEGILDNPALFLPRWGRETTNGTTTRIPWTLPIPFQITAGAKSKGKNSVKNVSGDPKSGSTPNQKQQRKLQKKLRQIARLEKRSADGKTALTAEEQALVKRKATLEKELAALEPKSSTDNVTSSNQNASRPATTDVALSDLHAAAAAKLPLAYQYLALVDRYPTALRSVIFHIRRICKDLLVRYQLMDTCVNATSLEQLRHDVLGRLAYYQDHPDRFVYDQAKAVAAQEALERQKRQEGQRKAFEARMRRKAKREGRTDLDYYLHQGTAVPTLAMIQELRKKPRADALAVWKEQHGQHCLAFHLDGSCARGRTCAFLHVDSVSANAFDEQDEVAG